jgi:hypothetical protein
MTRAYGLLSRIACGVAIALLTASMLFEVPGQIQGAVCSTCGGGGVGGGGGNTCPGSPPGCPASYSGCNTTNNVCNVGRTTCPCAP